ncbi:MAG: Gfo/Idh/MocA family oxidoreductase [Pseudomonadota bacterium]
MTRILVIGGGLIGARHIAVVVANPNVELAGVVDPDPARHAAGYPGFATLDAVNVPVDAAIIATPTETHVVLGAACAARGWAILVEKPIAADLAGADALITACARAGVPLLVGHHRRHHAAVHALRDSISAGRIGRVIGLSGIWAVRKPDRYFEVPWRQYAGGSPVLINLVHDLDLLRFVMGEIADLGGYLAASARSGTREDSGALVLRFASGALGTILFSDAAPSPWGFEAGTGENPHIASSHADYMHVLGSTGALSFPSLTRYDGAEDWSQQQTRTAGSMVTNIPLDAQLAHFTEIVTEGVEPLCSGADGRRALELALRIRALSHGS